MAAARWRLHLCGISHQTASVTERESIGFDHTGIAAAHAEFCSREEILEGTILSTCNRVEFYFFGARRIEPFEAVRQFYLGCRGVDIEPLRDRFYLHLDREAAAHLFRVAGGLDSMVLGENQILGQMKEAYSSACRVRAAGPVIHRLFHQAFRVGKQIRSDTDLGRGACSVASAAMELVRTRCNGLVEPSVLFVGVNQMIELAASILSREVRGPFLFANRTEAKALALADRYDGRGYGLNRLPDLLSQADLVVTCTGAQTAIIDADMIAAARRGLARRLVLMDMAVPRDVDFQGAAVPGVEVLDLEDVQRYVATSQRRRELAVPAAEEIVQRRLEEFVYWFDHVCHVPLAVSLEEALLQACREELAPLTAGASDDMRAATEQATDRLVRRLVRITAKTCNKCSTPE